MANTMRLDNPVGIIVIYLGFGAGLAVFVFSGFIKAFRSRSRKRRGLTAATRSTFFLIVLPFCSRCTLPSPSEHHVDWNDYLLPYLVIGSNYRTIPIAVQYLQGGYGSRDMGAMMAMLVLAIIPIIVFYLISQEYIIKVWWPARSRVTPMG